MNRHRNGKRNRERADGRTVDRWEWVYTAKSGKKWVAVFATLNDRGFVNVQTRRGHTIPYPAKMEAAERIADFLATCPGFELMPDHEQRYRLIWGRAK